MRLRIFCALSLTALPSFAAKRIQMDITDLGNNKVTSEEIVIDNARLKMNTGGDTVVMFLTAGGNRLVMLDKKKNEYQVIDQATMDQLAQTMQAMAPQMAQAQAQMAEAMKSMTPEQRAMMEKVMKGKMPGAAAAPAASAPLVFTAKGSGNANGFKCTNYDGTRGGEKEETLCASTDVKLNPNDYQVFQKMKDFTSAMLKAAQSMPFAKSIPPDFTPTGVQGFPVTSTSYSNGKATSKIDLKSVGDVSVTDADFSTGNAKKVEMNLPKPPKGK